jgi:hypothetical protein
MPAVSDRRYQKAFRCVDSSAVLTTNCIGTQMRDPMEERLGSQQRSLKHARVVAIRVLDANSGDYRSLLRQKLPVKVVSASQCLVELVILSGRV